MPTTKPAPRAFDFRFPHLDTLVRVEENHDGVVVRASRDTFTERRKQAFIRQLAAEGFIPDEFQWQQPAAEMGPGRIRWLVDTSWLTAGRGAQTGARRFVVCVLTAAALVGAAALALTILK